MPYTGDANTILNEYGFLPAPTPFTPTEQPHTTSKYEFWDLGAGDHMLSLANPGAGMKLQVKFSP